MKKNILIYDPDPTGHHKEYILHLLHYLKSESACIYSAIHFHIHRDLKPEIEALSPIPKTTFVWIERHSTSFVDLVNYCKENQVDYFCFMYIDDTLVKPQNLKLLHQNNIKIQGIYFRPFMRISDIYGSFLQMLKYQGSRIQHAYYLMRSLSKLDKLLVLNDLETAKVIRKYSKQTEIVPLCDPIDPFDESTIDRKAFRQSLGIAEKGKVILCFGTQQRRKNLLRIIAALEDVATKLKDPIYLLIVGKIYEPQYLDEINVATQNFNTKNKISKIILVNRFIEAESKKDYFSAADVVAIPYVDFFYSSGVFIHALHFRKPVIGSKSGLVNQLIEEYEIGVAVNPHKVSSIATGLMLALLKDIPEENYTRYFEDNPHSQWDFAQTFFNA